jgi:hypothetical protein
MPHATLSQLPYPSVACAIVAKAPDVQACRELPVW